MVFGDLYPPMYKYIDRAAPSDKLLFYYHISISYYYYHILLYAYNILYIWYYWTSMYGVLTVS